ncbi:MAG: hypothetical protein A4E64_01538 [Syntrophorhabdus sp. PtaU1.Bin058]|nr:MAG: hypothetical protein A4E64_01538 [Syntrophorhabdus sp. PtaU1.Bin058]
MIPEAFVCHNTLNRLRVRIPSKRRNAEYFTALEKDLITIEGVESVIANPVTASLLLVHNVSLERLSEYAAEKQLFSLIHIPPKQMTFHDSLTHNFNVLDKKVKDYTQGATDIGSLAFLGLAGAGIYQISKGNFTAPAWYTAFWYALNIFLKTDKKNDNAE